MRKVAIWLGAILAVIGLAAYASSYAPAAARTVSHRPLVQVNGNYSFQNQGDALWLHASQDYQPVSDSSSANQTWDIINPHVVGGVTYVQVKLHGTSNGNWCTQIDTANVGWYLEPCDGSNLYQYYYVQGVPGTSNSDWFVPYEYHGYFMTDDGLNGFTDHHIYVYSAGAGSWAIWGDQCHNC